MDWHDVSRFLIWLGYLAIVAGAHWESRKIIRWGHKAGLWFMSVAAGGWVIFYTVSLTGFFGLEQLRWMSRLAHLPVLGYFFFLLWMVNHAHDMRAEATKRFDEELQ